MAISVEKELRKAIRNLIGKNLDPLAIYRLVYMGSHAIDRMGVGKVVNIIHQEMEANEVPHKDPTNLTGTIPTSETD